MLSNLKLSVEPWIQSTASWTKRTPRESRTTTETEHEAMGLQKYKQLQKRRIQNRWQHCLFIYLRVDEKIARAIDYLEFLLKDVPFGASVPWFISFCQLCWQFCGGSSSRVTSLQTEPLHGCIMVADNSIAARVALS